jgi:hypothetical protein
MSSFLSLPFPTIGEFACLFFDFFFYSMVENSQTKGHLLVFY